MWYVVNFTKDNSVAAVPCSWYTNGMCAWPLKCSNIKKFVLKNVQPNKNEFKWYTARRLGSRYGNYILIRDLYNILMLHFNIIKYW